MIPKHLEQNRDKTDTEFLPLSNDPWGIYKGTWVETFIQPAVTVIGFYQGTTKTSNKIVLNPVVTYPLDFHSRDRNCIPYIEESPSLITGECVTGMKPRRLEEIQVALQRNRDFRLEGFNVDPACLI